VSEHRTYVLIEGDALDDIIERIARIEARRGTDSPGYPTLDLAAEEFRRECKPAAGFEEASGPHIVCWRSDAERRHLRRKAEDALRKADDVRLALALKTLEVVLGVRIL